MKRAIVILSAAAMGLMLPGAALAQQSSTQESSAQQASAEQNSAQKTATQQQAAQTKTPAKTAQADALAAASRKALEAQKKEATPPKVFTNDNVTSVSMGNIAVMGNENTPTETTASTTTTASSGNDEAAWKQKFAKVRAKLQHDEQELSVLQREDSVLQLQYYPDPTKALMQSYTRSDITKKQEAIAAKQKEVDADKQAISALEDALRKAGGDPGWARE